MNRRSRERRPARHPAFLQPKKRFLVVCEGERTEPEYLRGLNKHFSRAIVELDIPAEHGVPLTLVKIARRRKENASKEARRTGDDFHAYDQVWCAFDIDEHPNVNDAKQLAGAHAIDLAISNPCIELWLLLHFRDNPGMRHRHDLQSMMRDHVAGYDKGVSFDAYLPGYEEAVQRAQRIEREAEEQGEEGRNPSTSIWKLTQALRHG